MKKVKKQVGIGDFLFLLVFFLFLFCFKVHFYIVLPTI